MMNMACACPSVGAGIPMAFVPKSSWKHEATTTQRITIAQKRRSNSIITTEKAKFSSSATGTGTSSGGHDDEGTASMKIKYEGTRRREKELTEMIQMKIREAEEVCGQDKSSDGCKVAWDEVEEICEAKANLRLQLLHSGDPLHNFCQQHPETDECRIYQH